ncbi:MAG: C4-type zinc ribbon domain-containing protein [Bacteroidales bacterium]
MTAQKTGTKEQGPNVEDKLKDVFELQQVESEIDKIQTLRGELPLEVQDLEDELVGLETRIKNFEDEIKELENAVVKKKIEISDAQSLIKKYETQQNNVRNNREFDSLSKEIEFQSLEIQLCEKRIKEFSVRLQDKQTVTADSRAIFEERKRDLEAKKRELGEIISETQIEEENLYMRSQLIGTRIDERLLSAYRRIRKNARNGLGVVTVQRDACGGCFNRIPPQRQLDIRSRRKIIVCEYCGRILVDDEIAGVVPPLE